MDLAQTLIRNCMRAFYDTKHILVIDALMVHSALRDDDLGYLMGMNTKDLHKVCGKLKEDRFLEVFSRPEIKENQVRPTNRTYYFIDYRATIDAIKWRMYSIDKAVQGTTVPAAERKEFFCGRCKSEWTMMDVLSFDTSPEGFHCQRCQFVLRHDTASNQGGHEKSTKLSSQFKFITEMLPKIDQVVIPENNFEKALAVAVPVERDASYAQVQSQPLDASNHKPTAVKGMATGPTKMSVTVTTSEGPTEAELAAERARKEKVTAQNAMPQHFTHSTITNERVKFDGQPNIQSSYLSVGEDDKKDVDMLSDAADIPEVDDYFAQLKAAAAKEAAQEREEEDDDSDEEDEDAFEEIALNGSVAPTPAASTPGVVVEDEDRPAKKVKVEEHEESDEDNMEFIDV